MGRRVGEFLRRNKARRQHRRTHAACKAIVETMEPRTMLSAALLGDALSYPLGGFNDAGLSLNGGASISVANYAPQLLLTDGGAGESRSAFSTQKLAVGAFSSTFNLQMNSTGSSGIAMVIQGGSASAVGGGVDGASIPGSAAISLRNAGGVSTTLLTLNGVNSVATNLDGSGIHLGSGDLIAVTVEYDGSSLLVSETNPNTLASASQHYTSVNIPSITGGSAFVGFTGADGTPGNTQNILSWQFADQPPVQSNIGNAAAAGSFGYQVGGIYNVNGAGTGIGSTSDQLSFLSQPIAGDTTMVAKVTVPAGGSGTKAGLMLRDTLAANSSFAWVGVSSAGVQFLARSAAGAASIGGNLVGAAPGTVEFIKLVSNGPMVSGYVSPSGADGSWALLGTASVAITIDNSLSGALMGLAVWSGSSGATATAGFANVSRIATVPIGVDTGAAGTSGSEQEQLWVNVIKEASGFFTIADNTVPVAVDANGWPTADFAMPFIIGERPDAAGVYHLSMNVSQNPTIQAVNGTISNQTYNAATHKLDADVTLGTSGRLSLTFTNTGHGATNIQLIRPGYNPANPPVFTDNYLNYMRSLKPRMLRFMNWLATNDNPVQTWAQRALPSDPTQTQQLELLNFDGSDSGSMQNKGIAWEYAIMLANALHSDMWINIPAGADDNYVQQLANLIKNGDTVNGVTYAGLNPDLNVYIEYSNEQWNPGFAVFQYSNSAATSEVVHAASLGQLSNLNYDNLPMSQYGDGTYKNSPTWQNRWTARRLMQIGNIFGGVFGASSINTRIRPVLSNIPNTSAMAAQLSYINGAFGPPKNFFYTIATVAYANMLGPDNTVNLVNGGSSNPNLTASDVLNNISMNAQHLTLLDDAMHNVAEPYGLQIAMYESGVDLSGIEGTGSGGTKVQAELSPQFESALQQYYQLWFAHSGGAAIYFTAGVRNFGQKFGDFQLTDTTQTLDNAKEIAFREVVSAQRALPAPGTPTGLKSIFTSDNQVSLVWDSPVSGATEYRVQASNLPDFSGNVVTQIAPANSSAWAFTGLLAGTTYYFRVSGSSDAGDSTDSVQTSAATTGILAPPAAPSNATATVISSSSIRVHWADNSLSETSFAIDIATNAGFTQNVRTLSAAADATHLLINDLNGGTSYYVRVRAINGAGPSAAAAISPQPVSTPVPTPVALYTFSEGSGNVAIDSSPVSPAANGQIQGGVTRVAGPNGMAALSFDGSTGQVNLGTPNKLAITGQITVGAWFKTSSVPSSTNLISRSFDQINSSFYLSITDPNTVDFGTYRVQNGSFDAIGQTPAPVTDGKWHFLAGVYDATDFKVFLDGQLLATTPDRFGVAQSWVDMTIGAGDGQYNFTGSIADVQIYNTGLSNKDVSALSGVVMPQVPFAQNDSYGTLENVALSQPLAGGLLANDTDMNNQSMTASVASAPANGSVTINPNGSFLYTPGANFVGTDSFTYIASDSVGPSSPATVTITVTPQPVTGLNVSTIASDHVVLNWNNSPNDITGITVQQSTDGAQWLTDDVLSPTAHTDTVNGLTPGTTYVFRVVVNSAVGNSSYVSTPPINTAASAVASKLVFAQEPSSATAGVKIAPAIVVDVQDQFGNIVATDSSMVTLSIFSGPAGGALVGTVSVAAVNGVATFNNIAISQAGAYTLQAGDGSLASANSASVQIVPVIVPQAVLSNHLLTVSGTSGDDTIGLALSGGTYTVTEDGAAPQMFQASDVQSISLAGGDGNDTIVVDSSVQLGVTIDGGAGNDSLVGGSGNDLITGDGSNDTLIGNAGNDYLIGGGGDDLLRGAGGNDTLWGGWGNDTLYGGSGSNVLYGKAGNDLIFTAAASTNIVFGGVDSDTVHSLGNDTWPNNDIELILHS